MDRGHRYAVMGAALVLGAAGAASADPRATIAVECLDSGAEGTTLIEVVRLELASDVEIVGDDASWHLRVELSRDGRSATLRLAGPDGTTTTRELRDLPGGTLARRIAALATAELVHAETSRPAAAAPPPEPPAELVPAPRGAHPPARAPAPEGVAPLLGAGATLRTFFPAVSREDRIEGVTLLGVRTSGSILARPGSALRLRGDLGVEVGHSLHRLGDTWIALFVAGLAPELEASYGAGVVGLGLRAELALAWARGSTEDWNVREREGTALLLLSGAEMSVRHRLGRRLALEGSVAGGITIRGLTIVVDRQNASRASGGWVMLAAGVAWLP